MNGDAQIARQWALRAVESAENAQPVSEGALAAARHILATTPPPTMADAEWEDGVHAGLCAETEDGYIVRMLERGHFGHEGHATIMVWHEGITERYGPAYLTPIPGTRLDLTPRREQKPESTPDHPEVLETEEDYENAPKGTVAALSEGDAYQKGKGGEWFRAGSEMIYPNRAMAEPQETHVLRWGWGK